MQLDKAIDTAFEILSKESLNDEMVQLFGAQAPVNSLALENVNKARYICMSEYLLEKLREMHVYTNLTNFKCAFFLFGHQRDDGSIFLSSLVYDKGQSTNMPNFNAITTDLANHIEEIGKHNIPRRVIVHGHTSGAGIYSDNFSLQDIATYIMMSDLHPLIRNGYIKTIGGIYNSSGDINFVSYDKRNKAIYKFPNVYVEYDNGEKKELPAYLKGIYVTNKHSR